MVVPARHRPEAVVEWRPEAPEARQLAASLRSQRLTLVVGPPEAQITALLTGGVFPLLGRRTVDALGAAAAVGSATVLPFPERRRQPEMPETEILVLVDTKRDRTLEALEFRFETAVLAAGVPRSSCTGRRLAERIEAVTERHGSRFLFLFDGFETLLGPEDDGGGRAALISELVVILNRPIAANLLFAVRDGARARLEPLLARLNDPGAALIELASETGLAAESDPQPEPTPGPGPEPAPAPPLQLATLATPPKVDAPVEHADKAPPPPPRRRSRSPSKAPALALAAAACAALVAIGWVAQPSDRGTDDAAAAVVSTRTPPAAADTRVAPSPKSTSAAPAAALPPKFDLLVEAEGDAAPRVATELATALGADTGGGISTRTVQRSAATRVAAPGDRPQLAIVRYDELRALADADDADTPIAVLAPMPAEPVYVVVRDAGPLRSLGDLRGKRLNLGPPDTGRAVTGRLLYRQMFGAGVPESPSTVLDTRPALQALARDGAVDAVLLVGESGRAQLDAMPADTRRALRVLAASPDDPASRKAWQLYLPAPTGGPGDRPAASLASLGFLVAGAGGTDQHAALVRSLCRHLEGLQRNGDPRWRDVQAGQQLPIALKHLDTRTIQTAWAQCAPTPSPTSISAR